jgi:hypothetical protein
MTEDLVTICMVSAGIGEHCETGFCAELYE